MVSTFSAPQECSTYIPVTGTGHYIIVHVAEKKLLGGRGLLYRVVTI